MPDFDRFERLLREAMVAGHRTDRVRQIAGEIGSLPGDNTPELFKHRSASDLEDFLVRGVRSLDAYFGGEAAFTTSDDNRLGADLLETATGTWVELKSGEVTDANVGLSTIAWAFGDTADVELRSIMAAPMEERRSMFLAGDLAGVEASKERTMVRLLSYFQARVADGSPAPSMLAHFARCVAKGVTTLDDARALVGSDPSCWTVPIIMVARWAQGWVPVTHPFEDDERVLVVGAFRQARGSGRDRVPRAQVRVRGERSGRTALFYPNFKNSYHRSGHTIPASAWVETACFHVWIDK
jgi:hypothetical protein